MPLILFPVLMCGTMPLLLLILATGNGGGCLQFERSLLLVLRSLLDDRLVRRSKNEDLADSVPFLLLCLVAAILSFFCLNAAKPASSAELPVCVDRADSPDFSSGVLNSFLSILNAVAALFNL